MFCCAKHEPVILRPDLSQNRRLYLSLLWYAKLDNLEYNIENERRHHMNHVKHVIPMSDTSDNINPEDIQPTVLPDAFIQSDIVRKLNTLSLPRYNQLRM